MPHDTYFLIRRHPRGGFAAVACRPDTDSAMPPAVPGDAPYFATVQAAVVYASATGATTVIHPECETEPDSGHTAGHLGPAGVYDLSAELADLAAVTGSDSNDWVRLLKDWSADTGNPVADDMRREAIAASERVWANPDLRLLVQALQAERERGRAEGS